MSEQFMIRERPPRSSAIALLQSQSLPVADITDEHLEHFFFSGPDGSPKDSGARFNHRNARVCRSVSRKLRLHGQVPFHQNR